MKRFAATALVAGVMVSYASGAFAYSCRDFLDYYGPNAYFQCIYHETA